MARTRTTYSAHPKLLQTCMIVFTVLTIASFIAFLAFGLSEKYDMSYIFSMSVYLLVGGVQYIFFASQWIEINDNDRTLTVSSDKKHPVDIMKIDRIARHHDRKGRVKYLTVHEVGVKYVEFNIRHSSEQAILENLKKINPDIEIVSYRY